MKCSMLYDANAYGNKTTAAEYLVKLKRGKGGGEISTSFDFDKPAEGRGIGYSRGSVRSVLFTLPAKAAEAPLHALQLALSDTASNDVQFRIEET